MQFCFRLRNFRVLDGFSRGFFPLPNASCGRFGAVQRHYGADLLRWNRGGHQVSHAHQVVGRTSEGKHPIHF